jgi:hypothetical protein
MTIAQRFDALVRGRFIATKLFTPIHSEKPTTVPIAIHPRTSAKSTVPGGRLRGLFESSKRKVSFFLNQPWPTTQPWGPADIAATVYEALGISPETCIPDQFGRPMAILDHGQTIVGVLGT